MANSRTLLVYVLALVVCSGCSSSLWVSANTVPLLKEPMQSTGVSPSSLPQYQRYQQQHHRVVPQQQQLTAQHQQIQETSRTSPSPPSSSPRMLQHQTTDNSNNAPPSVSIKNAWGLSAGNSDSGPYLTGHSYISGRSLPESIKSPKSAYELLLDDRTNRQVSQNIFPGLMDAIQGYMFNGVSLKSILMGGLMTYGIQNFGIPESVNTLIPIFRYFRSSAEKKEKEAPVAILKDKVSEKKEPEIVKEVPVNKEIIAKEVKKVSVKNVEAPVKKEEIIEAEVKEVSSVESEEVPVKMEIIEKEMKEVSSVENDEQLAVPEVEEDQIKNESDTPMSRKRRDALQPDTDLTQLATMVLSAIQSAECMQRSICILGSQIGASNKGRTAFLLLDKLVPESVQGNEYFVTMKKALRNGENFCDKFRCQLTHLR